MSSHPHEKMNNCTSVEVGNFDYGSRKRAEPRRMAGVATKAYGERTTYEA